MKKSSIWFIPAICVALGILLLSTILAFPVQVEGASNIDKVQHTFAYFVLTFSFLLAFYKINLLSSFKVLIIVALASLYGFGLELAQYFFFEFRMFEWYDALANFIGVLIGFGLFKLFFRG